jgi:pimeloyl-ACP methyl ester carboxylesterase
MSESAAPAPRDGFVVAADGTRIAYRDHGGEGPPLVLLHGGGANLESMDQYAERLRQSHRCVAVDVRCCGHSGDPTRFRLVDAAADVESVARGLGLGAVDVLGHSLGGFLAGFYGSSHRARVVSIDGFGPGMVTVGTAAQRREFRSFQDGMREAFFAMTAGPEVGDERWRDEQVEQLCSVFPQIGYTAPNARAMAERNLVEVGQGRWARRPPRHLFSDAFEDDGEADVLRMYRHVKGPTMIVRCTRSDAPPVLDVALDELSSTNPNVTVVPMPFTHLEPAWDTIDEVVALVQSFLTQPEPGALGRSTQA